MIARLIFYLVEAAVLAGVAWFGFALAMRGLRRLGAPVRMRNIRTLAVLWVALSLVGVTFGERLGPEFVMSYYVCFAIAVGGASVWLIARLGRRVLVED